jgi:hypothetical protein
MPIGSRSSRFLERLRDLCREFNVALMADTHPDTGDAVIAVIAPGEDGGFFKNITSAGCKLAR